MLGVAQQRVTVNLDNRPIEELFQIIEQQTHYRIFCDPELSDSLIVSINEINADPAELIQKMLQNSEYQLSIYKNILCIIKDRTLITTLPESFYRKTHIHFDDNDLPLFERETKSTSEALVYAIGNPSAPSSNHVIMTGFITNFKTGEPVPGVTLLLESPFIGTTTDAFGFYSIRLPP